MAMNYEFERHIEAAKKSGNENAASFLQSLRNQFNIAKKARIVEELPVQNPLAHVTQQLEEIDRGIKSIKQANTPAPADTNFSSIDRKPRTQDSFYTVIEVASLLQLNPETVRRKIKDGEIKGFKLGGNRAGWRVRASEIYKLDQK